MGIVKNIRIGRKANRAGIQSLADLDRIMDQALWGEKSYTGVNVSGDTAMNFSAVFCAVQLISQTVASLPLFIYKRVGENGKKRFPNHPLHKILHNTPNPEMTSFSFRESLQGHLCLWGNAYSQIIRNGLGQARELWPINPDTVKVEREGGRIVYKYREGTGEVKLPADKVLHIPALGFDGRVGYSVINKARQSIGLGLATEEFGARFFGNGSNSATVLEHPGHFNEKSGAPDRLRKQWTENYGGLSNAHKPIILEEGMKIEKLTIPPDDAQFLQTRKFQVEEIARWFNLPPHKLKDLDRATFNNIEELQIEFVMDCIRPWLVRWEQVLNWKLLDNDPNVFVEFNIEGLLRGNIAARSEAYNVMRTNGIINANEWRSLENMNPQKGEQGDIYLVPLNMQDASKINEIKPVASNPFEGNDDEEEGGEEEGDEEKKSLDGAKLITRLLERGISKRAAASIQSRRRVASRYKPLFELATRQILEKERKGVMTIAKKAFGERDVTDFSKKLFDWYEKNKPTIRKAFAGIVTSYANDIKPIAMEEVGATEVDTNRLETYVNEYVDKVSNRYAASSRGQLVSVARKAIEAERDPIEAVEARIADWETKRPDKVSNREIVNGECAFAQFVYFESGFETRWVTMGKSCPYCDSLNGMVISRGGCFLSAGTAWEPEGATHGPMVISTNIMHPAAHGGCDCSVMAG